jgi:hypothetical protein
VSLNETAPDHALSNVAARLYSHNTVKMAMTKLITATKTVIAAEETRKADAEAEADVEFGDEDAKEKTTNIGKSDDHFSDDEISQIHDGQTDSSSESEDADEEDSEDSEDEEESHSHRRKRKASFSPSPSPSPSPSISISFSFSSDDEPRKKKAKQKVESQPSNSMFVPSLTAVGYALNSDSEASDLDEEVAPRKNRRGQKARQAIWEKKYKEKAKHLQAQKEKQEKKDRNRQSRGRDDGWDARRGAVGHRETGANAAPVQQRGAAERPILAVRKADNEGPLHPSWEAKKLLKAKEKMSIDQYVGKKITF